MVRREEGKWEIQTSACSFDSSPMLAQAFARMGLRLTMTRSMHPGKALW